MSIIQPSPTVVTIAEINPKELVAPKAARVDIVKVTAAPTKAPLFITLGVTEKALPIQ